MPSKDRRPLPRTGIKWVKEWVTPEQIIIYPIIFN